MLDRADRHDQDGGLREDLEGRGPGEFGQLAGHVGLLGLGESGRRPGPTRAGVRPRCYFRPIEVSMNSLV
jgi:hypothetical protein